MHPWIEAAYQYGLENVLEQLEEQEAVHGVMIEPHPIWLYFWKLHLSQGDSPLNRLESWFFREYFLLHGRYLEDSNWISTPFNTVVPFDLNWRPTEWKEVTGNKSSLLVKIFLRPGRDYLKLNYEGQLTIRQEHRQVPRFSLLEGGLSIGHLQEPPGTLGGLLFDHQKKQVYALTCGHVLGGGSTVDQPAQSDSPNGNTIGKCILHVPPTANGGKLCNKHNADVLNDLDIALVEIDSTLAVSNSIKHIGPIHGITPGHKIGNNIKIEYTGRSTGYTRLLTGAVGVIQEVRGKNGDSFCFKELIELREPSTLQLAMRRPIQGGDSGAWVTMQGDTGTEWCAMVVAEDRQSGYAIPAETIMGYLHSNGFPDLQCVPF